MTRKKGTDRTELRRSQILNAAQKVFGMRGYALATMDEVAETAGLSKGSLYNYFRSKQDLFATLFKESNAADQLYAEKVANTDAPAYKKLEDLLDHWFLRVGHFQELGRLVLEFYATAAVDEQGCFGHSLHSLYRRYHQCVAEILAQGQTEGCFELEYGPEIGARLLSAMIDGLSVQAQLGMIVLTPETLAALKNAIFDALQFTPPCSNVQEHAQ